MEKENIAWVLVRAFGIYFLAQVLLNSYSLAGLYIALDKLQEIVKMESLIDKAEPELLRTQFEISFTIFYFIFFSFLSYYCLRKGKFIHKLLMYVESKSKS